jgi:ribosome-binding factor A
MKFKRSTQVAEELKRVMTDIIANDLRDPRLGFITVTGVDLADDLRYAKVFISIFEDETRQKECLKALEAARGYIRRDLGRKLGLRYIPDFDFKIDKSIAEGDRIDRLLHQIEKEKTPHEPE